MSERIYLSPPDMSAAEREALLRAFDSNWIAPLGPEVDAFERELAERVGVADAAALSSGTAALHLALVLLDVGAGDEVWTSTLTFAATANAIRYVGATPVFVDSERQSWNMDPELLAEALREAAATGSLPKAVIVGRSLRTVRGLRAHPRRVPRARRPGHRRRRRSARAPPTAADRPARSERSASFRSTATRSSRRAAAGCSSPTITSLVERARYLASQARDPAPHYEHDEIGYNYRLSNLLAAVGRAQLGRLDELIERAARDQSQVPGGARGHRRHRVPAGTGGRPLELLADLYLAGRTASGSAPPRCATP